MMAEPQSTSGRLTADTLQRLAQARFDDAKALFESKRFDGAAYMCGYTVELALKACVCKNLNLAEYPLSSLKGAFKTHDFDELLLLAGVSDQFAIAGNKPLATNWNTVRGWKPEYRYLPLGTTAKETVGQMLDALTDGPDGVLTWLKKRW